MRIWLGLLIVAACGKPNAVLEISSPVPFTTVELFFVDAATPKATSPANVPHSTPNVPTETTAADAERWVRKFDPADVWTTDVPVSSASFGIPTRVGVGPYLAIVASDPSGPVAYVEILDYRDTETDTYELALEPIVLTPPPLLVKPPMQLTAPCQPGTVTDTCTHGPLSSGTLATTYPVPMGVTVHVRGVMESVVYRGGTLGPGGWAYGPNVTTAPLATTFLLTVNPGPPTATTYYLNSGNTDGLMQVFDYTASFDLPANATIAYGAKNASTVEVANVAGFQAGTPLDPTTGQYAVVDVIGATPITNAPPAWPTGAEIWKPATTQPSCLRLTTTTGTHFVTAPGDSDCDGFDDDSADCDATAYCDPAAHSPGCTMLCNEKIDHNGDQWRLGTCSNAMGARGVDACPAHVGPPSYCVSDDSACLPATPLAPHSAMLDCVMSHHPDLACTMYTSSAGILCTTNLQVSLNGSMDCPGAALLDRSTQSLRLGTFSSGCTVTLSLGGSDPATVPATALLGVPSSGGGYDTVAVKVDFMMAANGCTGAQQPMCMPIASDAPHSCR